MKRISISAIAALLAFSVSAYGAIPHLENRGNVRELIVDNEPMLILGGELGNSSGESGYLADYWAKFHKIGLNTLLLPTSWALIEPQEGVFDWSVLDDVINDARTNHIHLVLLWFGSWKNSMSCYVPDWVKKDTARFPRVESRSGSTMEILTPFSEENLKADVAAFTALMKHVREIDADHGTVIMVQVENEIGMIGDARDHSKLADKAFEDNVPVELMDYISKNSDTITPTLWNRWLAAGKKTSGTWTDVFGKGTETDEIFMAWNYARYTGAVAAAGKAEYPLPMYANAALIRPGYVAGQYPAAGPLPHLADIWRAGAPALDFLSPDLYFKNFSDWVDAYNVSGNTVFIPENLRDEKASVNALYAIGQCDAIGYCPFGIEYIAGAAYSLICQSYSVLAQLEPLILANRGTDRLTACIPQGTEQRQPKQVTIGGVVMSVTYDQPNQPAIEDGVISTNSGGTLPNGAIIIETAPEEFVIAGIGVTVTFAPADATREKMGILSCEEGHYENGEWVHKRWLCGDETHQGRHISIDREHFGIQRVRLYRYN